MAVVADLLGLPAADLDLDTPLEELGFSSILATQMLKRIQTGIDPGASLSDLTECRSTRDLVRRFTSASAPAGQELGLRSTDPAEIPELVAQGHDAAVGQRVVAGRSRVVCPGRGRAQTVHRQLRGGPESER